ncbi:hypothetical protein HMI56_005681 [Coelomomyces lativittatus]|nr:hypothetical protein HMI56_005681 [Coelomomyces lativittatus]
MNFKACNLGLIICLLMLKNSVIHGAPPRVIALDDALTTSKSVVKVVVDIISDFLFPTNAKEGADHSNHHGKVSKSVYSQAKYSPAEVSRILNLVSVFSPALLKQELFMNAYKRARRTPKHASSSNHETEKDDESEKEKVDEDDKEVQEEVVDEVEKPLNPQQTKDTPHEKSTPELEKETKDVSNESKGIQTPSQYKERNATQFNSSAEEHVVKGEEGEASNSSEEKGNENEGKEKEKEKAKEIVEEKERLNE